jgi:HEAT repeats
MRSAILLTATLAALGWGVLSQTAESEPASPDLVAVLVDALQDENPDINGPAARGLQLLGPAATDGLISLLERDDPDLRVRVSRLLSELGDRRALSPLARMYRNADDDAERVAAITAIAAILDRAPGRDAASLIAGIWSSNWGPVTIDAKAVDARQRVVLQGSWVQGAGMDGVITAGTFEPDTGIFEYSFDEPWHNMSGTARLRMSPDGNRLNGTWTFTSGGSGTWTMWRE